ncbi:hypothetical protein NF556_09815 [Ornithinimicrobium faecis]|uniref:Uncharacterized protein n=1 Tax=Ornithinimicrobium faecis TaxID=2934158 RepID=A0ABY4Z0K8_9MICO|nr:hypothetical protein [Ornithinimicrobium sp. HY1793]USQ81912.1 hypothetical protein NF556_09815 [Ornithinimicrobium sp. HY1793]
MPTPAVLGAAALVIACIFLWVVDPGSRPIAVIGGLFFGGGLLVLLTVQHANITKDGFFRTIGAASAFLGVACALGAFFAITDPASVTYARFPASSVLIVCILGAIFFGLGGLCVLIRGRRKDT